MREEVSAGHNGSEEGGVRLDSTKSKDLDDDESWDPESWGRPAQHADGTPFQVPQQESDFPLQKMGTTGKKLAVKSQDKDGTAEFWDRERQQRVQQPVELGQLRAELEGVESSAREEAHKKPPGEESSFLLVEGGEGEGEVDEDEADEDEAAVLLIVYTVLTLAWLLVMARDFMLTEGADTWLVGVYYAFVTTTTIGFGDLTPNLTKSRPLTYGIIFVGLLLMGQWLGAAGGFFFKCMGQFRGLFYTHARHDESRRRHVPFLITPMHAIASLVHAPVHAIVKTADSASGRLHANHAKQGIHWCWTSVLLHEVLHSLTALLGVIILGGAIFHFLEFPAALTESDIWWEQYDGMMEVRIYDRRGTQQHIRVQQQHIHLQYIHLQQQHIHLQYIHLQHNHQQRIAGQCIDMCCTRFQYTNKQL
jgi:hypothetical protein